MPTFTTSSSLAALSSCSTCPVLDCREIDRRRNAVAGRTVLTTALVLHAECAGNRGGVCGSNVAEAGRRHAVRAAESDGPEIDRTFKTGIGFTFEELGDAGICAVCR